MFVFFKDKSIAVFHIDGTDEEVEGTFVSSTDGTPLSYTNFFSWEPNNCCGGEDCLAMFSGSKLWNDYACNVALESVCEIPWWANA